VRLILSLTVPSKVNEKFSQHFFVFQDSLVFGAKPRSQLLVPDLLHPLAG